MYHAVGLLTPDSDFNLNAAQARLAEQLPGFSITREGDRITLSKGDWWIAVALASGPEVEEETEGLIGRLAGLEPAEADEYVQSGHRVEVWTELTDPFLEHLGDFQTIVGVLKSFNGLLAVDPKEPGLL